MTSPTAVPTVAIEIPASDVRIGDRIPVDPQTFGYGPADPAASYAVLVDLPDLGPTVCAIATVTDVGRERRYGQDQVWTTTDSELVTGEFARMSANELIVVLPR